MPRGKPLARSPLARTGALRRLALTAATSARRRRAGFDRATKAAIYDRDRHACVIAVHCDGRLGTAQTVHHLENRGMGGAPSTNVVTNGVAACHLDNVWVEDHPQQARDMGWKRPRGTTAPVVYPDGRRYDLLPDGTKRPS